VIRDIKLSDYDVEEDESLRDLRGWHNKILQLKIGDRVTVRPTAPELRSDGIKLPATVNYIHPKGYFCVVEATAKYGKKYNTCINWWDFDGKGERL